MRVMATSEIANAPLYALKPFNELTDEERSALTVEQLSAYKEQALAEQRRHKKEYRNLLNKLKREADLAEKAPWEDRARRNRFLFRLGVGMMYHMAQLAKSSSAEPDKVFHVALSHISEDDRPFTSDFYIRWKAAGFPTAEPKTQAEIRHEKKAAGPSTEKTISAHDLKTGKPGSTGNSGTVSKPGSGLSRRPN
jgi:hypothetical protein